MMDERPSAKGVFMYNSGLVDGLKEALDMLKTEA